MKLKMVFERELEVNDASKGKQYNIIVSMSEPYPDTKKGGDWACSFKITGLEEEILNTFYGIDSFQSAINCILGIDANLKYLQREMNLDITWFGGKELGFKIGY